MRSRRRRILAAGLVSTLLFLAAQLLLVRDGSWGAAQVRWLTGPDPEARAQFEVISYGAPFEYLRVTGGWGNPTGATEFSALGLAVDVIVFLVLGTSTYLLLARIASRRRLSAEAHGPPSNG